MKFSIITPCYNSKNFISQTIDSIITQNGDFDLEYIIVDGKSNDGTIDIIKKYENLIKENKINILCSKLTFKWLSEKDSGMYSAINKGFSMATGDIYAYLNSDDTYSPGALNLISETFKKFPEINWVKGITNIIKEDSKIINTLPCYIYNQEWIKKGVYGRNAYFIHQDSVFWRKELWDKIEKIDEKYKLAGDYYLWTNFACHSPLWSINMPISNFRKRGNQLSENMKGYRIEQSLIVEPRSDLTTKKIKIFFWLKGKSPKKLEKLFFLLYNFLFTNLNKKYIEVYNNNLTIKETKSYIV